MKNLIISKCKLKSAFIVALLVSCLPVYTQTSKDLQGLSGNDLFRRDLLRKISEYQDLLSVFDEHKDKFFNAITRSNSSSQGLPIIPAYEPCESGSAIMSTLILNDDGRNEVSTVLSTSSTANGYETLMIYSTRTTQLYNKQLYSLVSIYKFGPVRNHVIWASKPKIRKENG